MKCVLIFNQLNDVDFIDADDEFRTHIHKRAEDAELVAPPTPAELATKSKGIQAVNREIDPNIVLQLFSPLIASQRFMVAQVKNPYSSVRCENGFLFVFEQFGDHVYVAINGDGSESEQFLRRKLLVLHRILGFLYGPVSDEGAHPTKQSERLDRWRFLSELLQTWCALVDSQQSFLVEAVEQLHVNQDLNACSIQLLEAAISRFRAAGDRLALHAMLIVNAKLLALYSSRSAQEIQSSDILLIILLVKQQFPNNQKLEDLFSMSYRKHGAVHNKPSFSVPLLPRTDPETYHSMNSGESSSDQEQYFSSHSTAGDTPPPQQGQGHKKLKHPATVVEGENPVNRRPLQQLDVESFPYLIRPYRLKPTESSLDRRWSSRNPRSGRRSARQKNSDSSDDSGSSGKEDHMHMNVMLQTPPCRFTPHAVHCIEIMPSITLVVVSEISKSRLSGVICQTLNIVKKITDENETDGSHGRYYYEVIDGTMRKLKEATKKSKGTLEKLMRDMNGRYEQAKFSGLLEYLDQEPRGKMTARLESCLSSLSDRLKDLFHLLYLIPTFHPDEYLLDAIGSVREQCTRRLRDYKDYLAVKSQRNFTVTSFVEEFPGLVHFICVNRSNDIMIAPSLNITQENHGMVDTSQVLKDKIWHMIRYIQEKLALGSTSMLVKDGDFTYSYYLWFQDPNTGQPLSVQQPYLGSVNIMPGVLAGHFYRHMIQQCFPSIMQQHKSVRCTELMCMHLSVLPSHIILKQMKRLASKLIGQNGEGNSSISLL